MVLEQFLDSKTVEKHYYLIFFISFVYVFLAYAVARLFFPSAESIAVIFTQTLLLVPSLNHIINLEEKVETKEGIHHFFRNHKTIFFVYLGAFLGMLAAFLVLAKFVDVSALFSYQLGFLDMQNMQHVVAPTVENLLGLLSANLGVMLICFVLSIFYGAGAVFLLVFNGSVFAVFLMSLFKELSSMTAQYAVYFVFLIHMIPEVSGFALAAIAGAIVSRAILVEHFGSHSFKNVMKNCLLMLVIAVALIVCAAVLELYVTAPLAGGLLA